jgi:hypothetical protein
MSGARELRKLAILDCGGVGADRLLRALGRARSERRMVVGARAQGALLTRAEFAALPANSIAADFDSVVGDFSLPELEEKMGLDFQDADIIVPVRDPLQRALMLYVEAALEPLHSLHTSASKDTFHHFLQTEVRPNVQCQRISGRVSFPDSADKLASNALYFDSGSMHRFCAGYAHFAQKPLRAGRLNEETTNFHDVLCMLDDKTIAKFMRQNRDDLLLSIWVRRTWEKRLFDRFAAEEGVAA